MTDLSIIIPTFNSENTICDCIDSILSQKTSLSIELVVVDGMSQDSTIEIIKRYNLSNIIIIQEPDNNTFEAMNKGVLASNSGYIIFLNSDDFFYNENVLSNVSSYINSGKYNFIYGNIKIGLISLNSFKTKRIWNAPRNLNYCCFLCGIYPPHPGLVVKKSLFKEVGMIPANHKSIGDLFFIKNCIESPSLSAAYTNEYHVAMRMGGLSSSGFLGLIRQNIDLYNSPLNSKSKTTSIIQLFIIKPFYRIYQYISASKSNEKIHI